MPPNEDLWTGSSFDQTVLDQGHRDFLAAVLVSFTKVPGFPSDSRDKLFACLNELKVVSNTTELADLGKRMEAICESAVDEIEESSDLRHELEEMHGVAQALEASRNTLSVVNAAADSLLEEQASRLGEVTLDNDPTVQTKKVESVAQDIKSTTNTVKKEVNVCRQQLEEAGERIRQLEEELARSQAAASTDSLTRLKNRTAFKRFIADALSTYSPEEPWCLVVLDIDDFRLVNNTHGYLIGDALLVKVSRALQRCVPPQAFLARYRGEEFVVLIPESPFARGLEFCGGLLDSLRPARWEYLSEGDRITISATLSAGMAIQNEADTPKTLLDRANRAVLLAKKQGGDRLQTEEDIT